MCMNSIIKIIRDLYLSIILGNNPAEDLNGIIVKGIVAAALHWKGNSET